MGDQDVVVQKLAEEAETGLRGVQSTEEGKDSTEKAKAVEGKSGADDVVFTDAQQKKIDAIIAERIRKVEEKHAKQLEEAERLKLMNAEEKAAYERKQVEAERDELKKRLARYEMGQEASLMLSEAGITVKPEVLDIVVRETAEDTQKAVRSFVDLVNDVAENLMKSKLAGTAPKARPEGMPKKSKADILKIKDPKERYAEIQKNPELFR